MFRTAALALSAAALASADTGYPSGQDCTPCKGQAKEELCTIPMRVNFHASETGYFEFPNDCPGEVNPNLLLEMDKTYVFDQSHISNWYHLIGLAYQPDGAHVPDDKAPELEPTIKPLGSDSTCDETESCPAPMYWRNGTYTGVYNNDPTWGPILGDGDFGLDAVEPEFFLPLGDWLGLGDQGGYKTSIRFNVDSFKQDFFYFCHIHAGMSGRVKLTKDGVKVSEQNMPELKGSEYPYPDIEDFDQTCGTFNLTGYEDLSANKMCPDSFLCGDRPNFSQYAKCVEAMNCHMMASMTTNYETNAYGNMALFCHQMIPHHQNAVNMAKSLLKLNGENIKCKQALGPVEEGAKLDWECDLEPLLVDIINVQNSQIIDMRDALGGMNQPEYNNCEVEFDFGALMAAGRRDEEVRETEERVLEEFESGIACTPCDDDVDMEAVCTVKTTVDMYASELGYYKFQGCAGINPTLHLKVGKKYIFDQSDQSNWYHLVGFAYKADGAHVPVDELEPGIPPPGTSSTCADDMSCPAPMYWRDGKYAGEYSNVESTDLGLTKTTGKDDFGLDAVEPEFFHPIGDWKSYGTYQTLLHFDNDEFDQDFFYFCHVHSGMSGRVKLTDADGKMKNAENTPALPYDYNKVSAYDAGCGTYALDEYQLDKQVGQCPKTFVCGAESKAYPSCIDSMNCAMLDGMTTAYGGDSLGEQANNDVILFLRQMIPHHKNAVNMAKGLLKTGLSCGTGPVEEGGDVTPECYLTDITYSIVNTQNKQIQIMEGIMGNMPGSPSLVSDCDYTMADGDKSPPFYDGGGTTVVAVGETSGTATPADGGDTTVADTTAKDTTAKDTTAEAQKDDITVEDVEDTIVEAKEDDKESGASKISVFTGFFAAFVTLFF